MSPETGSSLRWWSLKYALEWVVALLATVLLAPFLALVALLIKLQDGGPVLYIRESLGRDWQRFRMYKFRSMVPDCDQIVTPDLKVITLENDPRVTRLGRILRLGFDELPQLLNVLKGDMCLVGPRPLLPWEEPLFDARTRQSRAVLPGITGLAQVLDSRNLHYRDVYELDTRYVIRSSLLTDLLILACTIPYAFGAKTIGQKVLKPFMAGISCPNPR